MFEESYPNNSICDNLATTVVKPWSKSKYEVQTRVDTKITREFITSSTFSTHPMTQVVLTRDTRCPRHCGLRNCAVVSLF